MSILKADALQGKTAAGDIDVTSEGGAATMQLQQGLAKVWGNVDLNTGITTSGSFGVTSTADNGTGDVTFNFTNNMSNATYVYTHATQYRNTGSVSTQNIFTTIKQGAGTVTTGLVRQVAITSANTAYDCDVNNALVHGDLA